MANITQYNCMRSGQKYPNWRVVVITEIQDIFGDLYLTQSRTTLLSSCLIVFGQVVVFMISRTIKHSISGLATGSFVEMEIYP